MILGGLRKRVGEVGGVENRIHEYFQFLTFRTSFLLKIHAYLRCIIRRNLINRYSGKMEISIHLRLIRKMKLRTGIKPFTSLSTFTDENVYSFPICLLLLYSRGTIQITIFIVQILLALGRESCLYDYEHNYTHK